MQKWEYQRIQVVADSIKTLDDKINKLGLEGWELIAVAHTEAVVFNAQHYLHLYFKRPVIEK